MGQVGNQSYLTMKTHQLHTEITDDYGNPIDVWGDYVPRDPGDRMTPPVDADVINIVAENHEAEEVTLSADLEEQARIALLDGHFLEYC